MEEQSLSLSVRLRRSRTETAHVPAPITAALNRPDEEGSGRKIDVDNVIEAALRMGALETTEWESEGQPEISLHPLQNAHGGGTVQ